MLAKICMRHLPQVTSQNMLVCVIDYAWGHDDLNITRVLFARFSQKENEARNISDIQFAWYIYVQCKWILLESSY